MPILYNFFKCHDVLKYVSQSNLKLTSPLCKTLKCLKYASMILYFCDVKQCASIEFNLDSFIWPLWVSIVSLKCKRWSPSFTYIHVNLHSTHSHWAFKVKVVYEVLHTKVPWIGYHEWPQ